MSQFNDVMAVRAAVLTITIVNYAVRIVLKKIKLITI